MYEMICSTSQAANACREGNYREALHEDAKNCLPAVRAVDGTDFHSCSSTLVCSQVTETAAGATGVGALFAYYSLPLQLGLGITSGVCGISGIACCLLYYYGKRYTPDNSQQTLLQQNATPPTDYHSTTLFSYQPTQQEDLYETYNIHEASPDAVNSSQVEISSEEDSEEEYSSEEISTVVEVKLTHAERLSNIGYQGEIPDKLICTISQEIMDDPVITEHGNTYERSSIQQWISSQASNGKVPNDPNSNMPLTSTVLYENSALRSLIIEFVEKKEAEAKEQNSKASASQSPTMSKHP